MSASASSAATHSPVLDERPVFVTYRSDDVSTIEATILPSLAPRSVTRVVLDADVGMPEFPQGAMLLAYVGDEDLAGLVTRAVEHDLCLAVLPHPRGERGRNAFGVSPRLNDALREVSSCETPAWVDLFLCNNRPVLHSVVIGNASDLVPASERGEPGLRSLVHFLRLLRHATRVRLQPYQLTTRMERRFDTAALGIIAVEYGHNSILSRGIIEGANDGMLHALVLAPRSVLDIARYLAASLLPRHVAARRLPPFVAHIRTQTLRVTGAASMAYVHDGLGQHAEVIELSVAPKALCVIAGGDLDLEVKAGEHKESVKAQALPMGEAREELTARPLPLRPHAATEEFKDLFVTLRENARISAPYLMLMTLSTLLATFGLFAGSAPVIIGAMILAPLMAPIISLAMGVLRQEEALITGSVRTLLAGTLVAVGGATLLTWLTPLLSINAEIAARLNPTLLDLGVAVISGIAGAYAHARVSIARSLAGVAIAVALVPPLAVSGIGLGWLEWTVFSGAFLLFLTNLGGIILAAALTFLWLGYSPFRRAQRGLVLSLVFVVLVSIPLALGFHRMVEEHRVIRALDGLALEDMVLREVSVRAGDPLYISVKVVSTSAVDTERLDAVKQYIEEYLQRRVTLEAVVAVIR